MARDLGIARALRKLDRIPSGPAFSGGLGVGAALGLACLQGWGDAGVAWFIALLAVSALLVIWARPVAVPSDKPPEKEAHRSLGDRLRTTLNRWAAPIVAVSVGFGLWNWSRTRALPDVPLMPAPVTPPPAILPQEAPGPSGGVPEREAIRAQIAVDPGSARILLDGALLPANPFNGKLFKDTASHRIKAEAEGFVSQSRSVTLDTDITLDLTLQPTQPSSSDAAARGDAILPDAPRRR